MWERWRVWEHSLGVTTAGVHTARFTRSQFPEVSTSLWTRSVGCVLSPATLRHVFVLTGDSFVPPLTGPRRPSLPGPPSQPRRERDVYGSPTPPRARVEPTSAGSRPTPCIHTLVVLSSCGTRDGSSGSRGAAVATGACWCSRGRSTAGRQDVIIHTCMHANTYMRTYMHANVHQPSACARFEALVAVRASIHGCFVLLDTVSQVTTVPLTAVQLQLHPATLTPPTPFQPLVRYSFTHSVRISRSARSGTVACAGGTAACRTHLKPHSTSAAS